MSQKPLKIVVVGDGMVGKTCLLLTYTSDHFPGSYEPVVFETHEEKLLVDGRSVDLKLVDTAGQEDYEDLRPIMYSETDVFLLCFSLAQRNSFVNVNEKWTKELASKAPGVPIVLIGTKLDLRKEEEEKNNGEAPFVTRKEGKRLAKEIQAKGYMECSALTRENIREVFYESARIGIDPDRKFGGKKNSKDKSWWTKCGLM